MDLTSLSLDESNASSQPKRGLSGNTGSQGGCEQVIHRSAVWIPSKLHPRLCIGCMKSEVDYALLLTGNPTRPSSHVERSVRWKLQLFFRKSTEVYFVRGGLSDVLREKGIAPVQRQNSVLGHRECKILDLPPHRENLDRKKNCQGRCDNGCANREDFAIA
jgi:hypothetical protein